MATQEVAPSPDALVDVARELGPLIRENADRGERERRLPGETARGLTEAGFFRLCRPHQLGGVEVDPITVLEVVEEIARHDGSAAWCALNCSVAGVLQSFLAQEGAREIGSAPDGVVNGVFAPSGRAVEVEGGYRVNGRWTFVSNCHHCHWLALANIVFKGDTMSEGPTGPEIVTTWIKASDWRIIDTWDTAGLRATGSHDIEVSDVFVPKHRAVLEPPPEPVSYGPLFRFPIVGLFSVGIAASALGIAQAAIDELLRLAGTKTPFGMASTLSTRTTAQIAVAEAMATVRSARALVVEETSVPVGDGPGGHASHDGAAGAPAHRGDTRDRGVGGRCRSHVHHRGRVSGLCLEPTPATPSRRTRDHPACLRRAPGVRAARQDPARRRARRVHAVSGAWRVP